MDLNRTDINQNRETGKKLIITKINREIYIIVLRMEHILSRHT